jgi:hypothetical protein
MDPLRISLLDLLRELDKSKITLTVGGRIGLYLKRAHLTQTSERILFNE